MSIITKELWCLGSYLVMFLSFLSSLRRLSPRVGPRFPFWKAWKPGMREAADSRSAMALPYLHLASVRESPKAVEAMVAAGKSPKPTSSSSWTYTVNGLLGSLAIDELGTWDQARATWAAVICPTSRLSPLNLPWEVTHAHCPVQLVRVEMTIRQCWELPNEDAEPQDGKSTIPESFYGGNSSHEKQSHVTWAVTWVRNQFVKSLRFLGSSNIAVSITLKKQNKTKHRH